MSSQKRIQLIKIKLLTSLINHNTLIYIDYFFILLILIMPF